jgi:hypothetical protein
VDRLVVHAVSVAGRRWPGKRVGIVALATSASRKLVVGYILRIVLAADESVRTGRVIGLE